MENVIKERPAAVALNFSWQSVVLLGKKPEGRSQAGIQRPLLGEQSVY